MPGPSQTGGREQPSPLGSVAKPALAQAQTYSPQVPKGWMQALPTLPEMVHGSPLSHGFSQPSPLPLLSLQACAPGTPPHLIVTFEELIWGWTQQRD